MRFDVLTVTRGEPWVHPVTLEMEGFDFDGCTITAQVRENPETRVLATPTVTVSTASTGSMGAELSMTVQQTAALPSRCQLALRVQRTDPAFGPHSVVAAVLHVETPGVR